MTLFAGLLGMNRRNADYILPANPRKFYPLVDNKLLTKQILQKHGLPTPRLYFEILHAFELHHLSGLKQLDQFVIKPARGSGGRGILVIKGREGDLWKTARGKLQTDDDLEYHVSNILAGLYSLGGTDDEAFIEYCVQSHSVFEKIAFQGVPDIRIVLYHGVPVMAMLRLPTEESGGRANLHQGAIGVGVNMATGVTLGGVYKNRILDIHPDLKTPIGGVEIPFWKQLLEISVQSYDFFKLGYVGIDFVIDQNFGPLILELNARPGLNIQLANRSGLLPRLKKIDSIGVEVDKLPVARRLDLIKTVLEL